MILTSPSQDVDQKPPVTTTFDAPEGSVTRLSRRAGPGRVDWDRVERLYSFVRDRTVERLNDARERRDQEGVLAERTNVHAIDAMFAQARRRHEVVAACAITYFRARAMRYADHPEFQGEWLGSAARTSA
jgi:hypothetical protein